MTKILLLINIMLPLSYGYIFQNNLYKDDPKSDKIRKNLRGLESIYTSSTNPSFSPSSSPVSLLQPWSIGESKITVVGDNAFYGKLMVQNEIGSSVDLSNVVVELFDFNCENSKDSSSLEISLESNDFNSSPHQYNITIHLDRIGSSPGGFVQYATDNQSIGSIKFCTRISTYYNDIQVRYRETNVDLNFDLTGNQFLLSNLKYDGMVIPEYASNVNLETEVKACQCDHNFACYSSNSMHAISQDENLVLCLEPTDASTLEISNFNLELSDGAFMYRPVSLGSTTWQADSLTNVSSMGKRIKVSTPIVAHFFTQNNPSIDVSGSVQFIFGSSVEKAQSFASFELTIELNHEEQKDDCLKSIFRTVKSLF